MNKNNLPNNLYELRRAAGLSQEEFAEKLLVSRQAVSKWERGEAYPDTDNLIAISDMFGVSIDELLRGEDVAKSPAPGADTDEQSDKTEETDTPDGKSFRINVGDKINVNLKGAITVEDEDGKVMIDLDNNGIVVDDEDGSVKVGLGNGGITVNSDDGVKVKLGKHGISINSDNDDDDDDDGDEDGEKSLWLALPYPIVTVIAFLTLGILADGFSWAWTLFITIPVYYSLVDAIRKRRLSEFAYPVFLAFIYCLFGMLYDWWHPGWIIFLTIPVYSPVAAAIDRANKRKKQKSKS